MTRVEKETEIKRAHPAGSKGGTNGARAPEPVFMSWIEEDFENRFGFFKAGRYTSVNKGLSFLLAALLALIFFSVLVPSFAATPGLQALAVIFTRQGNIWTIGPAMVLFFWAIVILFIKSRKIRFQVGALGLAAVPQQAGFVLNETTAKTVLERIYSLVDHPRHFILLNRIERALSSLHNIGGLSDVSTILKSQAENDENQIASSYTLVNGMVWAVPVLGFIGTVRGLSVAIGNFTRTLESAGDLASIKTNLQGVTAGLATAFETTLVALVCALIIQLYLNFLQQRETDFLDECNDYCHSHVISKLRLVDRALPGEARPPASNVAPSAAPAEPASDTAPG